VVVIDDALMGITHVIRGEDHIPNTPKQILIYRALGFDVPKFAHLPVILGEDRSKLSKRHGAVSVRNYREEGYLPQALFNYLCLLGWSPPEEGKEVYSKEELIEIFDLKDINTSPAVFSKEKLRWMNGVYIREVISLEELIDGITPFLKQANYDVSDRDYLKRVLEKTKDSFETFKEAVDRLKPFFVDDFDISQDVWSELENARVYDILSVFLEKIKDRQLNAQSVKEIAREIQKELNVKAKDVWHSLRIALTGELEGVGVDILCDILPKEKIVLRVERLLKKIA
jgi:glutamyl-tRNA synthetase/nondiscriminating glutamyl-tRNA synthetase